jgi:hypothetical protein
VRRATSPAASGSDKHCCTGPTIAERFELAPSCDGARSTARRSRHHGGTPKRSGSLPIGWHHFRVASAASSRCAVPCGRNGIPTRPAPSIGISLVGVA